MMKTLEDLPWRDVINTHIFIQLDISDLLNLRNASRKYQEMVDSYLFSLKSLDLSSCSHIKPSFFSILVRVCESLRSVNLAENQSLQDFHLLHLLREHPDLKNLNLSGCNNERMRLDFFAASECKNLVSVNLKRCNWVTCEVFLALGGNKNLEEVILADCYQISEILWPDFQELKRFSSLSLQNCTITDNTVIALAKNCKTLETLDLRGCLKITDTGILSLRLLPNLKSLFVHGCSRVTERSLAPLRSKIKIDLAQKLICVARPLHLQV